MSEVLENAGLPLLTAGNNIENLAGVDRDYIAAVNVPVEVEPVVADVSNTDDDPFDDENTFDVSRAEFTELQMAFLRLHNAVAAFNKTSPHKILGI